MVQSREQGACVIANQEHVEQLKRGVAQWNTWRKQHKEIRPDLSHADLGGAELRGADLRSADLSSVVLRFADLCYTNLRSTDLSGADLSYADLSYADLSGTILSYAGVGFTVFAHLDLSEVKGLTDLYHWTSSRVELHTIQLPQDGSALQFLRGAGVPEEWINLYHSRMIRPTQYHSCFISYSHHDETLAQRLHADLQDKGVRCWFAPHDLKIGDKIRARIDEMIHLQDKLLLILSATSVESSWVEHEVEMALDKERKERHVVLFPVRIDQAILDQEDRGWPALVRHERYIGDFANWTNPQAYQIAFDRLLRDLKKADNGQELS